MKIEIEEKIKRTLDNPFEIENIETVPSLNDFRFDFENKGLQFDATVIYFEIRETKDILKHNNSVMLEKIRLSYFYITIEIADDLGGIVRRAHEDGLYIFFPSASRQHSLNRAVKAAMKIKYMLTNEYSKVKKMLDIYDALNFAMGIDCGQILCTKVEDEKSNHAELIWSADIINKAIKISKKLQVPEHIGISEKIHANLREEIKYRKNSRNEKLSIWNEGYFEENKAQQKYFYTSFFWTVT